MGLHHGLEHLIGQLHRRGCACHLLCLPAACGMGNARLLKCTWKGRTASGSAPDAAAAARSTCRATSAHRRVGFSGLLGLPSFDEAGALNDDLGVLATLGALSDSLSGWSSLVSGGRDSDCDGEVRSSGGGSRHGTGLGAPQLGRQPLPSSQPASSQPPALRAGSGLLGAGNNSPLASLQGLRAAASGAGAGSGIARVPSKRATSASSGDAGGGPAGSHDTACSSGRAAASDAARARPGLSWSGSGGGAAAGRGLYGQGFAEELTSSGGGGAGDGAGVAGAGWKGGSGRFPPITRPANKYARTSGLSPQLQHASSGRRNWQQQQQQSDALPLQQRPQPAQQQMLHQLLQQQQHQQAAAALQASLTTGSTEVLLQHNQQHLASMALAAHAQAQGWQPGLLPPPGSGASGGGLHAELPQGPSTDLSSLFAGLLGNDSMPHPPAVPGAVGSSAVAAAPPASGPLGALAASLQPALAAAALDAQLPRRFGNLLSSEAFGVQLQQAASGAFRRQPDDLAGQWGRLSLTPSPGPSASASHSHGLSHGQNGEPMRGGAHTPGSPLLQLHTHLQQEQRSLYMAAEGGGDELLSPAVMAAVAEAEGLEPAPVPAVPSTSQQPSNPGAGSTPPQPHEQAAGLAAAGGDGGAAAAAAAGADAPAGQGTAHQSSPGHGAADALQAPTPRLRGVSESGVKRKLPQDPPSTSAAGPGAVHPSGRASPPLHAAPVARSGTATRAAGHGDASHRRKSGRLSESEGEGADAEDEEGDEAEDSCDGHRSAIAAAATLSHQPAHSGAASGAAAGGGGDGDSCAASRTTERRLQTAGRAAAAAAAASGVHTQAAADGLPTGELHELLMSAAGAASTPGAGAHG